jgi:putative flavoprotein involved in K+ transport
MSNARDPERIQTVVIGAGQAGLSVGYHLARRGLPFVILDANARVGDNWRKRWDSLRLFTPARYDGLVGMAFPGSPTAFPTKNEMADFLEAYATRFKLPIRSGVKVERLSRHGRGYLVSAGNQTIEADHVVVAMSNYQSPRVPAFSKDLDPGIRQIHSIDYRNPSQLQEGAYSSWGPATRARRSRSRPHADTRSGCRAGTPARCRSVSAASSAGRSWFE